MNELINLQEVCVESTNALRCTCRKRVFLSAATRDTVTLTLLTTSDIRHGHAVGSLLALLGSIWVAGLTVRESCLLAAVGGKLPTGTSV
jgi:hypothetical protein